MKMLHRFGFEAPSLAVRETGSSGLPKISGYAAVFDSLSVDLGGFREKIEPGAFSRSLADGQDIRALFEHDSGRLMGRSSSGTLVLRQDKKGLLAEIDTPDTQLGRDVVEMVRRGDIRSWSFGFYVRDHQETKQKDGSLLVTLLDVDLREVSVVSNPAYEATSLTLNSVRYRESQENQAKAMPESVVRPMAKILDIREVANRQRRRILR